MERELIKLENDNLTIDSREVAEMMSKEHKALLKDIQGSKDGKSIGIIPTLLGAKFDLSNYFIESSYKDSSGKLNKCYLVTKMGCELLGNKQQGEKGILFTAKYVERFNQMEGTIKNKELALANKEIEKLESMVFEFKNSIEEAKQQFKPSHKKKLDYNKMIKAVTNNEEEAQIVKDWVFGVLNINKWEDTCIEDSKRIMEAITTVSKLLAINKFEQLSLL